MNIRNQCHNPVPVKSVTGTDYPLFRCGKCSGCLRQLKNELAVRAYRESFGNEFVFLTFTYDNENCPIMRTEEYINELTGEVYKEIVSIGTDSKFFDEAPYIVRRNKDNKPTKRFFPLIKQEKQFFLAENEIVTIVHQVTTYFTTYMKQMQLLLKRFRKKYPNVLKKFILVPEYGSVGYRPHFHFMVYGLEPAHIQYFKDNWTFGHVEIDFPDMSDDSSVRKVSSYLAKYAVKGQFDCPFVGRYCRKNRRSVSQNYGCGSEKLLKDLQSYLLAWDIFGEYDPFKVDLKRFSERDLKYLATRRVYSINGYNYPFPKYLIKKLMYERQKVFDSSKGKDVYRLRASDLQKAISALVLVDLVRDSVPKQRTCDEVTRDFDSKTYELSKHKPICREVDISYYDSDFIAELERNSIY